MCIFTTLQGLTNFSAQESNDTFMIRFSTRFNKQSNEDPALRAHNDSSIIDQFY